MYSVSFLTWLVVVSVSANDPSCRILQGLLSVQGQTVSQQILSTIFTIKLSSNFFCLVV